MNEKLIKSLSSLLSKMPKKELEKNISKAKEVLKNSKKEDLSKLISNPQISKFLGEDAENIKKEIEKLDINESTMKEIEKKLQKE